MLLTSLSPFPSFLAQPRRLPNRSRPGGAGYEIDLSNLGQRELLPPELAGTLPPSGYVNLAEAKVIADLARRWPTDRAILITSPDDAQVRVLRHYLEHDRRVVTAAEACEAECDWLVVSLSRSHLSRAVTYGDDPALMPRLMSRPRSRLLLVGDSGTLCRRAGWRGAVDNFDRHEGERERCWVGAVLRIANAPQSHPARMKA